MSPNLATDTGGTPTQDADGTSNSAHSTQSDLKKNNDSASFGQKKQNDGHHHVPKVTYSEATKASLPASRAERAAAIHAKLPSIAVFKDWHEQCDGSPVMFSSHPDPFMIAIPFDDRTTSVDE
ncbi:hypothetical protein BGZ83_000962, partial [Gryganskiella cystojenkinii]